MPVENEVFWILSPSIVRADMLQLPGAKAKSITQGYLNRETRIRRTSSAGQVEFSFTFKRHVEGGELVEIETAIDETDFLMLWPKTANRLEKTRYSYRAGTIQWDVDCFEADGETYIVKAEAERLRGDRAIPQLDPLLQAYALYFGAGEDRFSAHALSDPRHARALLSELQQATPRTVA